MDVIVGTVIALVIVSSVDRYLNPEEYVVAGRSGDRRPLRRIRTVRPILRRLTGSLDRGRSFSASHRCSISQVSPWLTCESYETVTARH